jgi:1,4-dihydroxy-2-naphthoate octaprenyltransferase
MNGQTSSSIRKTALAEPPSWSRKWLVAMRPFALPASTMPVVFGTVLAVTVGGASFKGLLFLAALLGMAILHTGANLLNDVYDYKKGIDREANPVSGGVVRGWVTHREALVAGWLFLVVGSGIGLFIYSQVGTPILLIGVAGVLIGILYTWGPLPLKYCALGDLAVFLNFGVLGALGAWTVQTGTASWLPAVWAVPMSLLVVGILHSNNWRDIRSDSAGDIRTMAILFGDRGSEGYYAFLLFAPFILIVVLLSISRAADIGPKMPLTFLVTLLAVPLAVKLKRRGELRRDPARVRDFLALDGATAQLNLLFGLLCIAALGLGSLIGP